MFHEVPTEAYPVPEVDKPGDGLIGATIDETEYGSEPNFSEVMKATSQIYPEFATALASAY